MRDAISRDRSHVFIIDNRSKIAGSGIRVSVELDFRNQINKVDF